MTKGLRYPLASEADPAIGQHNRTMTCLEWFLGFVSMVALLACFVLALKLRDARADLRICVEGAKALKENGNGLP